MQAVKESDQCAPSLEDRIHGFRDNSINVMRGMYTAVKLSAERRSGQSADFDVGKVLQMLKESIISLDDWALRLGYWDDPSRLESVKFRDMMEFSKIVYIVESCHISNNEDLQRIFDQIETTVATLSERSVPTNNREEWYTSRGVLLPTRGENRLCLHASRTSYYEAVNQAVTANAKSLVELHVEKSKIWEQLFLMTRADILRVLASGRERETVLLSIGGSRRLRDRRPCWELIVIILDGGGVSSYSSLLIMNELMFQVGLGMEQTNKELVRYQGMQVHPI